MAAILDLGHTALRCHDLSASLTFYAGLGIHESFRLHKDDGTLMLVYLHIAGDRFLELFPGGSDDVTSAQRSFMHICLVVDDIAGLVAAQRARGVPIDRDIKLGKDGNLQAWIHDPDGNPIELMQLSEGSPQRRIARGEHPG
jgi:lactoylglutathione lyase